jgi:uncharacterized protein (DUF1800 family)
MKTRFGVRKELVFLLWLIVPTNLTSQESPIPKVSTWGISNATLTIQITPQPSIEEYLLEKSSDLGTGFRAGPTSTFMGYSLGVQATENQGFYRLRMKPLSDSEVLTSTVLNRLAYGPTPDELDRVLTGPKAIGPEAYIREQIHPEQVPDDLDAPMGAVGWHRVTYTGVATSSTLYLYLDKPGEVYLDSLSVVPGSVPAQGTNLLTNGDFESPLTNGWTLSTNLALSALSTEVHHEGSSSLHLVATSAGSSKESALWQTIVPAMRAGQTYTLAYWYLPSTHGNNLTVRFSGSGGRSDSIDTTHSLVPSEYQAGVLASRLQSKAAVLDDLRAWFLLHAVRSQRQLLEVLTQFLDNHFTTQYSKSRDYIDGFLTNQTTVARTATDFEFRELSKWRTILLNPNGTFLDLLRVSVESPAMVIYLDTVTSAGGNANENFSRELLELFTMGVDNGYDQSDIEEMSRAWTGWRVDKLPEAEVDNPFATPVASKEADPGLWTLRFRTDRHDTKSKLIFKAKTLPTRFGTSNAGKPYQLALPARTGTEGMKDGYEIIQHLADLPYTQEYISVKLCRLFVHDHFTHGVYNYADPASLSPEGQLIAQCMAAWESLGPDGRKGNIRRILEAIFSSELFRHQAASRQKVKTPLEFVASTVRSLRAARGSGTFTADTDGYDVLTTLRRLNMTIFDRADPDGWPEEGKDWVSTAALVERMRFAQNFLIAPRNSLKTVDFGTTGDDNVCDPVSLVRLRLPQEAWRDPSAVVDLFLQLLFPGEGAGNLALDRQRAIAFLNADDTGTPDSSPFPSLDPAGTAYDARVRSMTAMLLCLPRFQEQ